jgi:hypothetical protein
MLVEVVEQHHLTQLLRQVALVGLVAVRHLEEVALEHCKEILAQPLVLLGQLEHLAFRAEQTRQLFPEEHQELLEEESQLAILLLLAQVEAEE